MMFDYEKEHLEALYQYLPECTLFLKRDDSFPLEKPCSIAAYGCGVRNTVKGGSGSGEVNSRFFVNVEDGLLNRGFTITSTEWLNAYQEIRPTGQKEWHKLLRKEAKAAHRLTPVYAMGTVKPEPEYDLSLNFDSDACIYVISRMSGEGADRRLIKGDMLLTVSWARRCV